MALSFKRIRDYVYTHGVMWERVLFAHLFERAPLAHLHQCLACYKNPDGGWGHGMEHDIKTPESHPLAMEFALSVFRTLDLPPGRLFNDAPEWLESHQDPDGSLRNPSSVLQYPCAPWWQESGGQTMPDSIVGNLTHFGICTPSLAETTQKWVETNLTLEKIEANEWLFMAYHAHDYFMHVDDFPNIAKYRAATIDNIVCCAKKAPIKQYYEFFMFATKPDSAVAKAASKPLLTSMLDCLLTMQQEDGAWQDEHGLPHWYPYTTILVLNTLRNYGIWNGDTTI